MSFRSPWKSSAYVRRVDWIRRLLRPFGDLEDRYIVHLAEKQNRLVQKHFAGRHPQKVLLIMPRCVKRTHCRADVQNSLEQCLSCDLCPLGEVARMCERHGIRSLVAFRSHIAFELARRHEPDLIIATACHDRLVKALRSVPEYPALLAPLAGMQKQCVNAGVDLAWLERQLAALSGRAAAVPSLELPSFPVGTDCPASRIAEGP